jgi:hypothetical protein
MLGKNLVSYHLPDLVSVYFVDLLDDRKSFAFG